MSFDFCVDDTILDNMQIEHSTPNFIDSLFGLPSSESELYGQPPSKAYKPWSTNDGCELNESFAGSVPDSVMNTPHQAVQQQHVPDDLNFNGVFDNHINTPHQTVLQHVTDDPNFNGVFDNYTTQQAVLQQQAMNDLSFDGMPDNNNNNNPPQQAVLQPQVSDHPNFDGAPVKPENTVNSSQTHGQSAFVVPVKKKYTPIKRCMDCDKQFSTTGNLREHRRIHEGQFRFSCNICQKPFNNRNNFQIHMLTHDNPKSFLCTLCKRGFNSPSSRNRHENRRNCIEK